MCEIPCLVGQLVASQVGSCCIDLYFKPEDFPVVPNTKLQRTVLTEFDLMEMAADLLWRV